MVARTIGEALLAVRPTWQVEVLDYFEEFVGSRFNRWVAKGYFRSLQVAPVLYGLFYQATHSIGDRPRLQARMNSVGRKRLRDYLLARRPDLVLCTYPTPAAVLSSLKVEGAVGTALVTILTDYAVHSQWTHPGVDLYLVAGEPVRDALLDRGTPAERVVTTGIPVRPSFAQAHPSRPSNGPVLVMFGALGQVRGSLRLCRALSKVTDRTVVVCGRDEALLRRLRALPAAEGRLDARGFVEDVDALMAESRLLVTKPGGVTVSEALAMGLPMVLYRTIPGHERENEKLLVEVEAAVSPGSTAGVCREVTRLLGDECALGAMSQAAKALGRPHSARDGAAAIVSLVEARNGSP